MRTNLTPNPKSLRSYDDYINVLVSAGGYCTDPIGKCLREQFAIDGDPKKDIQLCMKDSDTFAACLRGERLSEKFVPAIVTRSRF